jgi:hypothetical protein
MIKPLDFMATEGKNISSCDDTQFGNKLNISDAYC